MESTKDVKQVIVVRKDLNMRKGKIAAQVAHAALENLLSYATYEFTGERAIYHLSIDARDPVYQWLDYQFTKVVVSCNSEEELLELESLAKESGIRTTIITDAGKTEFHGVPTKTCMALGPDYYDKLDEVTGHLKLL